MNFRVDSDSWFVFSILFIGAMSFLVGLYIVLPFIARRRQLKRIRGKRHWRNRLAERIEKASTEREVSALISRNESLEADLHKALKTLIKSKGDATVFGSFFSEFEKVHPDFNEHLQQLIAGITAHELKLCALIRMRLSAKEIGGILNISPSSVNTARYRLRKKMDLSSKEDLDLFLLSV